MMTDDELKQIAVDLHGGKIWSDLHCKSLEDLKMSFLIVGLMGPEDLKKMQEEDVDFIYEYLSEAGPRSVNGMPIFFSMRTLTKPDAEKMLGYYAKLKDAIKAL